MPKFTVQCLYPIWYEHTETVRAKTVEEACERAIRVSNDSSDWKSLDDCGDTFVQRIVTGAHEDAYPGENKNNHFVYDDSGVLPVPAKYSEHPRDELLSHLLTALKELMGDTPIDNDGTGHCLGCGRELWDGESEASHTLCTFEECGRVMGRAAIAKADQKLPRR